MKKIMLAIAIFCTYSLGALAQDSAWKSTKKGTPYKNKKDSIGVRSSSNSTMKKNKMWKKGIKDNSRYKNIDTAMPMEKRDTMK